MKVLVTSDTHGYLPEIIEPLDLLLICGDVCPAHDHYFSYQKSWFMTKFVDWVNSLPFADEWSRVVLTWGNHDYVGERLMDTDIEDISNLTNGRLIILKNETYHFVYKDEDGKQQTLTIFGTPYCKIFGNWAFMVSDTKLHEKYSKIPEGVDILISHDSPTINRLGMIQEGWNAGVDAGNLILDQYIRSRKPKYFFSGHIHSGNHVFELVNVNETDPVDKEDEVFVKMANVSYINERYRPVYDVLEFEI